ncbi:MAG: RagB/SusD family nutrient uptake outer membrane protein [Tannerella sp.]|nr:RagB/SusD family nutrient uptake outer membrane protein [Tannerella sp.]
MKNLNSFAAIVVGSLVGWSILSCSDETINDTPVEFIPVSIICGDSAKIVQYVNNMYTFLPGGYNRLGGNSMVASATDEAVHAVKGTSEAELWSTGRWNANYTRDNTFSDCYTGIRRSFVFEEQILPNIENIVMSPTGKDMYYGQALFLRAYFNFELLKRYGGYPLVKKALSTNEDLQIPRSAYDTCVEYIVGLCDEAAGLLPLSYANNQLGRATKGAALALKARILLYAASPLFNDPSTPEDHLEHGAYNPLKWEDAAAAAASVISLKNPNGSNVYSLYANGTGYDAFFYTLTSNNEIILSKMAAANNTIERLNGPASITNGEGGTCPTLDLANDYEMISGVPFDWNNPAHAANPFADRDPRFGKSILYNGAIWMNNMVIETFDGGKDLTGNKATRSGFYLRKFLNINARWNAPTGTTLHCFPLLRYGEVLLNYAEAMNEAYGPDVDPKGYGMTARNAIQLIRTRAGLTANTDLLLNVPVGDQNTMRDAIRHERRIELAFEEHRHLDVRRWKIAESILNRPVSGIRIVKNNDDTYVYSFKVIEERVFTSRMYLYPFPQSEISRNKNLVQNTGW